MNQGGEACGVAELPLVGEPGVEIAGRPSGQVHQQLREIELRIDLEPAARGGQARKEPMRFALPGAHRSKSGPHYSAREATKARPCQKDRRKQKT